MRKPIHEIEIPPVMLKRRLRRLRFFLEIDSLRRRLRFWIMVGVSVSKWIRAGLADVFACNEPSMTRIRIQKAPPFRAPLPWESTILAAIRSTFRIETSSSIATVLENEDDVYGETAGLDSSSVTDDDAGAVVHIAAVSALAG